MSKAVTSANGSERTRVNAVGAVRCRALNAERGIVEQRPGRFHGLFRFFSTIGT